MLLRAYMLVMGRKQHVALLHAHSAVMVEIIGIFSGDR